jgi:HD-like signal output (HDOD) protein/CheY-like chemotaxis protein
MKRFLFVDDEPNVLHGLRRMLHHRRQEWEVAFATSGAEALALLAQTPFDAIVSDIQMPGMTGAELLNEVQKRYPHIVRLALTGQTEKQLARQAIGAVHHFLWKPCDSETLQAALLQACSLSDLLGNQPVQRMIAQLRFLPSLPSLYLEIVNVLRSPEASAEQVGEIIARDISMSAKVLQLANSALYGPRQRVGSPAQATILLGLDTIKDLVLSIQIFSQFSQAKQQQLGLTAIWEHALAVGAFARRIARLENLGKEFVGNAFSAGLLHDVGRLVLADNLTLQYHSALGLAAQGQVDLLAAEQSTFGVTHAQVGAYLLGLWGLPESMVTAVAHHHVPSASRKPDLSPLAVVHAANVFAFELYPKQGLGAAPALELPYLEALGLTGRLAHWREECLAVAGETNHGD